MRWQILLFRSFTLIFFAALVVACGAPTAAPQNTPSSGTLPPPVTEPPRATPTITPTSAPLSAVVNGEGVLLSDYQAELQRLISEQEAAGIDVDEAALSQWVLNQQIDTLLLAQAARENGYEVTATALDERLNNLVSQLGSVEQLAAWQQQHGYTDESFRAALAVEMAAAFWRDQIIAAVPETAEQVHARQILLLDRDLAGAVYNNLQSGAEFATLAETYDPVTGGELGWFPRGYLTRPELEEAAFSLAPNDYSAVIETDFGFHIIQVLERSTDRPLSSSARLELQKQALANWLAARRDQSEISILVTNNENGGDQP